MAKQLQEDGFAVGRYKARRLMHQAGVAVRRPRQRRPVTTDSRHGYAVAPNLLARQFDVERPDQVWVGDITYVWTAEGWLYLLCFWICIRAKWWDGRRVVRSMRPWCRRRCEMALGRRQPAAGLLHHSDRGSQYAVQAYQGLPREPRRTL